MESHADAQFEAAREMMLEGGASMVYHFMSDGDVDRIMRHPQVALASDAGVITFGDGAPAARQALPVADPEGLPRAELVDLVVADRRGRIGELRGHTAQGLGRRGDLEIPVTFTRHDVPFQPPA